MKLILLCRVLAVVLALFLMTYFAVADTSATPEHWIFSVPFQKIEAGSFTMGSPSGERGRKLDEKQVQVTISKPFEIMTTEVTQSMWVKVMGENPSKFKSQEHCDDHDFANDMCPNNPVEMVTWEDVQEFIRKLNEALGLKGCDGTPNSAKNCYRLPTEVEWEYVARAGTTTAYFFGNDPQNVGNYAWYYHNLGNKKGTHKVGLKPANPWGIHDVYGNVFEWVEDMYARTLLGGEDPFNTAGSLRVFRGGSWDMFGEHTLRSAFRYFGFPDYRYGSVGFRLVRTL